VEVQSVEPLAIAEIVRRTFGHEARVASVREIVPRSEDGVLKIVGCSWNLSYVVALQEHAERYVLRFNRNRFERGDATLQVEADNYALISERTSIPTPRLYRLDTSREIVPTGYLVMDYMEGEPAPFLAHPDNPRTTAADKAKILRRWGAATAELHGISRPAAAPDAPRRTLLGRLEQLEHVVQDGQLDLDLALLERCREAVTRDERLLLEREALLVADAELNLRRVRGDWRVSFICDLEWVGYGDPTSDLVNWLCAPMPLWAVRFPLEPQESQTLRDKPIFRGYQEVRGIDWARLQAVALTTQLALMCSISCEVYNPQKRAGMKECEPVYARLLQAVANHSGG
jgi:aminoglycoside phosphotransferase (APT) family kinase protein